jgi:hypothetical protein
MFFSSAADLRQFHPGPVHVVDAGRLPGRRPADLRVAARAAASGRQVVRHRLGSARNLLQVSARAARCKLAASFYWHKQEQEQEWNFAFYARPRPE